MFRILLILSLFLPFNSFAKTQFNQYFNNKQLVGDARFRYYFWDVYDIALYAPQGRYDPDFPFGLKIDYLRELKGGKIAKVSVDEMREIGFKNKPKLQYWYFLMKDIFPDVAVGDSLIGIYRPNQGSYFYNENGDQIGVILDDDFGKYFFGIWLNEKTSMPDVRVRLLSGNS